MRLFICCLAMAALAEPAAAQPRSSFGGEQLSIDHAPVREDIALTCAYATECYEAEGCQEAGFGYALSGRGGGMNNEMLVVELDMVSDIGDVTLVGLRSGGYALSGGSFDARHLLSIAENGDARHTVHYMSGPQVISYIGQCVKAD
ncbi:hypothetical protein [Pacificoceanicola onchidii]|uniref:hypothetical protein n=1 Tax=Pacificoceanicola onchidii TaxID=2562685 RepID=UPI0010A5B659|nr:hypothetical protein [Pacificoceanicola onchidii]